MQLEEPTCLVPSALKSKMTHSINWQHNPCTIPSCLHHQLNKLVKRNFQVFSKHSSLMGLQPLIHQHFLFVFTNIWVSPPAPTCRSTASHPYHNGTRTRSPQTYPQASAGTPAAPRCCFWQTPLSSGCGAGGGRSAGGGAAQTSPRRLRAERSPAVRREGQGGARGG